MFAGLATGRRGEGGGGGRRGEGRGHDRWRRSRKRREGLEGAMIKEAYRRKGRGGIDSGFGYKMILPLPPIFICTTLHRLLPGRLLHA